MPLNEHSTHSIPPFCPLSMSSATRKNVIWCAWRFIKFELQHGIESHRRRRNCSSNELEKPFLERRRKWMRRAKSRKKKENWLRTMPILNRYPANCFWSFQRHPSSVRNNPWLRLRISIFYERILDRMSLLSTIFRRSDLEFLSFAFVISDVISLPSFVYNGLRYTK